MSQQAKMPRLLAIISSLTTAVILLFLLWQTAASAAFAQPANTSSRTAGATWIINEFLADPASDINGDANGDGIRSATQDEFIELINHSGTTANISGWTLSDGDEIRHTFPPGTTIPDQCAIIIFGGGEPNGPLGNAAVQVASSGRLSLDNTSDTITLSSETSEDITITYTSEANEDQSLTRDPDISGDWTQHTLAAGADSRLFSPGTKVNGSLFSGCSGSDDIPFVQDTIPVSGAVGVPLNQSIVITFSEPVSVAPATFELVCTNSGIHDLTITEDTEVFVLDPIINMAHGEECAITVFAEEINDLDTNDPPDHLAADYNFSFSTLRANHILINEVDAETPDEDTAEFIELFDGGAGNTALTGLSVVLFKGQDDQSYKAFDLADFQTNDTGYFLLGNISLPGVDLSFADSLLLNGADAVALYNRPAADFPLGTPVSADGLLDALVYDTDHPDDRGLLDVLTPGEPQVDENGGGFASLHSNQRCPNGSGGQRISSSYQQKTPTPKVSNNCPVDFAPSVVSVDPANEAHDVPLDSSITITFSEAVTTAANWYEINCSQSGMHDAAVTNEPLRFILDPAANFTNGEICTITISSAAISDEDTTDPPDHMAEEFIWQFSTAVSDNILINEVDSDTPGTDTAEFVELYDGGAGGSHLGGLVLVLFNGFDDLSYAAVDLDSYMTGSNGYFVIGNTAVPGVDLVLPDSTLQNGPDAVALYRGSAIDFPNGTPLTTSDLVDALVYLTADEPDPELGILLEEGELQVDEAGRSSPLTDSNQRCPNGSGDPRRTSTYLQNLATPGTSNKCDYDLPPKISHTSPASGAENIPIGAAITITFSEPVAIAADWFEIACGLSGLHSAAESGDSSIYQLSPDQPFHTEEICTTTIFSDKVSDQDIDDPPDQMEIDYQWSFTTTGPISPTFMLINEVDADMAGSDTMEFIELYDGGIGNTALDGSTVVFFNGQDDQSYRAMDLTAQSTDSTGYFLIGNPAVPGVDLVIPDGILQNGTDAVALYAGQASDFPNGTAVTEENLIDALVYHTGDAPDAELSILLLSGEIQIDEDGRGAMESHSNQRCPNGSGESRRTDGYLQNNPTPGLENFCVIDDPPEIIDVFPVAGSQNIPITTTVNITFSEDVFLSINPLDIACSRSGPHDSATSGGPTVFQFLTTEDFLPGESCQVTVSAGQVTDSDIYDPPDEMTGDYTWEFHTRPLPVAGDMIINEIDADTQGADTLEFIELFDGGSGNTPLDGLVIVLYNGVDDSSYRAIDLYGQLTGESGYFVTGNSALTSTNLVIPDGSLQNGADAVALYTGTALDFPNGTAVTTKNLLDALVYDTNDDPDPGLLLLLPAGQPQVDEAAGQDKDYHSLQRCPNGQGGQLYSTAFRPNPATPGLENDCYLDLPPLITTTQPITGAADIDLDATLTITFSEEVEVEGTWFEIDCEQSGIHQAEVNVELRTYTLIPEEEFLPRESCTLTLFASQVTDLDRQTHEMVADFHLTFTSGIPPFGICGDATTPISLIQGDELSSPIAGSQAIIVEGLVTSDFQGESALNGFFVQEFSADTSLGIQASPGLFVANGSQMKDIKPGDRLRIQGDVLELGSLTSLSNTVTISSCQNNLPITPTLVTLPITDTTEWESYEGMLITIKEDLVVTGNDTWGREGSVALANKERLVQSTEITSPGPPAVAQEGLNTRRMIVLDDGSDKLYPEPLPPYIGEDNILRAGDSLDGLTGILAQNDSGYRIHPTEPLNFARVNGRPALPEPGDNQLRVVAFDLDAFFNGDGQGGGFPTSRGAATAGEFARQREKIISTIIAMDAAIIGLSSVENDVYGPDSAVQDLVNGLNDENPTYNYVIPENGEMGDEETAVAIIYQEHLVTPLGPAATSGSAPFEKLNDQPLVQAFSEKATGRILIIAMNHFQERDNCPADGDANADQGDGQACWNPLRSQAADYLVNWLEGNPLQVTDPDILILGNLNAYTMEDPLQIFQEAGYQNLVQQFATPQQYSSVHDGRSGTLIHALASPALTGQVIRVIHWHINADEPSALDYRAENQAGLYQPEPFRSAAHDPLIVDIQLGAVQASFQCNSPVFIGQETSCSNLSSAPVGSTYAWDFGDGSPPVNEEAPSHLYQKVGRYTVSLTVTTPWQVAAKTEKIVQVKQAKFYLPILSINSADGQMRQSLMVGGEAETIISESDPHWLTGGIVGDQTAIPLGDGYFEFSAPKDFLAGDYGEMKLSWVDFYR